MARTIGRRKITVTIAAGPVATPISATNLFTTDFSIHFPTTNAATEGYVGDSTVDTSWIPRAAGSSFNFVHGMGSMDGDSTVTAFNLKKIFVITSTPGDTAIVEYMAYDVL